MQAPGAYLIRFAGSEDAELIATHRAEMFAEMGLLHGEEIATLRSASAPWLGRLLSTGKYVGWLVEQDGVVVAGAGVLLGEQGPVPGCLCVAGAAHLANVFTAPAHRQKGLARQLMLTILSWCADNNVEHITLNTSHEARHLYESLGFQNSPEFMKLRQK